MSMNKRWKAIFILNMFFIIGLLLLSCGSQPVNQSEEDSEDNPAAADQSTVIQQEQESETIGIDDWNKEILSDKPKDTHVRYFIVNEDGTEETVLDVYAMTEEHDLDSDGVLEIVVYIPGEKRNIGVYDMINGELKYMDVSSELGASWSEFMGNMANLQREYSNYIQAGFETGGTKRYEVYQYKDNELIYVCPFDDSLLMK